MIDDMENSETRMRQALEALRGPAGTNDSPQPEPSFRGSPRREHSRPEGGSQLANRGRHRFVKDGEVPVVHLASQRPRDAQPAPARPDGEALQALEDLRQRASNAERAQKETLAQMQALQTKWAHTQMALEAANGLAERRQQENEALRVQLQQPVVPPPRPPREEASPAQPPFSLTSETPPEPPRRRGRPPKLMVDQAPEIEPEPVQWWLTPSPNTRRRR